MLLGLHLPPQLMLPFPKISRICQGLSKRCGDQSVCVRLGKWHPSSFVISAPERSTGGVLCDGNIVLIFCVMCNAPYHEACMGEGAKDGSMRGPCCPKE